MSDWYLYIIHCSDGSLYTGITTDPQRRFHQHATGRGARYFRGRRPLAIVHLERHPNRASASRRERAVKAMDRRDKLRLIGRLQTGCKGSPHRRQK